MKDHNCGNPQIAAGALELGRSPFGAGLSRCAPSPGKPGLGPAGLRSLSQMHLAAGPFPDASLRRESLMSVSRQASDVMSGSPQRLVSRDAVTRGIVAEGKATGTPCAVRCALICIHIQYLDHGP